MPHATATGAIPACSQPRSFGFTGGHFHRNWADEDFRKLVVNAILWSAKMDVPEKGAKVEFDAARLWVFDIGETRSLARA